MAAVPVADMAVGTDTAVAMAATKAMAAAANAMAAKAMAAKALAAATTI